ncbi:uncharacterized protein F5891DRAFT_1198655 [Suillus fuscotomentosus]|uniref:KOW domain-containing protein n=1 Tax=Suillus fuscotomentosus TaxID=1912939 RepID=A0AAD4DQ35_9AGAM|nr:uncharacterized protein F5891DRAFT_1198655 [Suillus fuscotomentosus]KAG1889590.1 hypothetical protein F5891DRAFT_1198655 [Suillus fuscotomentosus]
MSKRAGSGGDEPPSKRHCSIDVQANQAVPPALYNNDEWAEPRRLLFSGDEDNAKSLENFTKLWKTHIPNPPEKSSVSIPASRRNGYSSSSRAQKSHKLSKAASKFIADKADVGDDEEEEEEYDGEDWDRPSMQSPIVTSLPGMSVKRRLAATFDDMATRFEQHLPSSSEDNLAYRSPESRMYLLHVQRTTTQYVADHLRRKEFPMIVSAWSAGQLYVVADSPVTIAKSLPLSLYLAVKEYSRIAMEERTQSEFPQQAWVRIKGSKYRGDIAQVFEQLPNGLVTVSIVARNFPYSMPSGSRALIQRSLLPNQKSVSDIICDDEVVEWKYKGESYYMGLLLKNFHHDRLELVTSPHVDDIRLHLDTGWNQPFLNETVVMFSLQFLRVGDWVRVVKGSLRGELGQVVSTDHTLGTLSMQLAFDGRLKEMEVRLKDIEQIFRVSDTVRVVAGSYLGLEGHIIQICGDMFHLCQHATNEQVEVSKYYLDQCPLNHTVHSQFPMQQDFEPSELDSIQIGDFIEVLDGEHMGKRGVVDWLAKGDNKLWFRDILSMESIESSGGLSSLSVPIAIVQRTDLTATIQYTKERGYDVRPGDIVTVINVPIGFVMKVRNTALDSFKKDIGQEVFIIGGGHKGYRATLYSLGVEACTVAIHGQKRITVKLCDVVTKYGMRLNGAMLEGLELISFCVMRKKLYLAPPCQSTTPPFEKIPSSSSTSIMEPIPSSSDPSLSVNPNTSTSDPWTVDKLDTQDNIDVGAEKLSDSSPLAWLMTKEFFSTFFNHHAMLKVSPIFDASLSKRFVSMPCPDPFCGENGPAPEGCIAAYCTSNNAGAKMKHYHIPAMYLSPALPRKKNQKCLILARAHRGLVGTVTKCSIKAILLILVSPLQLL